MPRGFLSVDCGEPQESGHRAEREAVGLGWRAGLFFAEGVASVPVWRWGRLDKMGGAVEVHLAEEILSAEGVLGVLEKGDGFVEGGAAEEGDGIFVSLEPWGFGFGEGGEWGKDIDGFGFPFDDDAIDGAVADGIVG